MFPDKTFLSNTPRLGGAFARPEQFWDAWAARLAARIEPKVGERVHARCALDSSGA
jgi:hypothetical protein